LLGRAHSTQKQIIKRKGQIFVVLKSRYLANLHKSCSIDAYLFECFRGIFREIFDEIKDATHVNVCNISVVEEVALELSLGIH